MKKSRLRKILLTTCVCLLAISATRAETINSKYVGPAGGKWSRPANWSPSIVPDNTPARSFNVSVGAQLPGVFQDIDVTLNSLTLTDDASTVWPMDHNLTSAATSLGSDFAGAPYGGGIIFLSAAHRSIVAELGNLAEFSGTTFNTGNLIADAALADAGVSATIRFNGADIRQSGGDIQFTGPRSYLEDKNGDSAIRHFQHNLPSGIFHFEAGRSFTTEGSLVNEGETHVFAMFTGTPIDPSDHGVSALTTLTVNGNFTMLTSDAEGYVEMISKGAGKNARLQVKGVITDYDPATKTLKGGLYELTAGEGGACIVQVLGEPLDIVKIESFMSLIGPNTTFLDSTGANALRNLSQTGPDAYFRIGDRDFKTAGDFTSAGILSIRGNSHFNVSGDLTITGGLFNVTEQTGYNQENTLNNYAGATEFGDAVVSVAGKLTLADPAMTRFDITPSAHTAQVHVAGSASLGGTLTVFLIDNMDGTHPDPAIGNGRTLITASSFIGSFDNVKSGGRVLAYSSDRVRNTRFDGVLAGSYKVTYDNRSLVISDFEPHASMLNISTRADVRPGNDAAIGGFIIRGVTPKQVMLRGIGPSLASQGINGALQDPVLRLYASNGALIVKNDDWQKATQADRIAATGIAPADPKESAIIATLEPGSYTAVLRGTHNTAGIGSMEVYDLDEQPAGSEFANLSTRGYVGTGDDVMIGGTIIGKDVPANMVIRALGPSLASKGVHNALPDPTLEVFNASGVKIAGNDEWQSNSTQAAKIQEADLAPADPHECALTVTLKPGNYTAIVRGKDDTTGISLVEFYKLN
ncbi:MAG: hypothetical protein H0U43_01760 [Chthoniobacterales bacterium]|nr:hypothetical protein [Chthoniobacterales bacterium]